MLEFIILENGNLRLKFDGGEDDRTELLDMVENMTDHEILREITESYWTNGWFVGDGEDLYQLTQAPIICEEGYISDNGDHYVLYGKAWSFMNYQVTSMIDEILNNGFVDFEFWAMFDGDQF